MIRLIKTIFFLAILLVIFSSCSKYEKLLKSNDFEKKYAAAIEYYQKQDYYRALQLFDDLIPFYRGTERVEQIMYYYGDCYFNQGQFLLAAYHFRNFARTYASSPLREEAYYMSAYCYYKDSPAYYLDQTNTQRAINEMQLFINMFPESAKISEANQIIDELRGKLERKAYQTALLYLKTKSYSSAIIAFKNVLKDFPDTKFREQSLFNILKASYLLAINSIESKKPERLKTTLEAYNNFVSKYPESDFLREATSMKNSIEKLLATNK